MEPVGSMSISPANRDVVLAARKGLFIIDLEDPFAPPRFWAHMTTGGGRHPMVTTSSEEQLGREYFQSEAAHLEPRQTWRPTCSSASHTNAASRLNSQRSQPHHAHQSAFRDPTQQRVPERLQQSKSAFRRHGRNSQWLRRHLSKFAIRRDATVCGITAIGRAEIFRIEHVLHAHTRAITDINWSPFHPEMVASSSIDTWTWVWDLRMSGGSDSGGRQKPAQGYSAWNAAVTQVKFNRASEHRLASTCDNKVLIWDDRKALCRLHHRGT